MDEFKESVKDLKKQLSDFIKDYYTELVKIWSKIVEIETKQKMAAIIYGGMSGIFFSVVSFILITYLKTKS